MIKFTDVCKAYVRYWFVILIAVVISLAGVMAMTRGNDSYTATNTVRVIPRQENADKGQYIQPQYAELIVGEMTKRMQHDDFLMMVIDEIKTDVNNAENTTKYDESDKTFAETLNVNTLKANMSVAYTKGTTIFDITYKDISEKHAALVADTIRDEIIKEQAKDTHTQAELDALYSTKTQLNASKKAVYAVIGILIGLVLGIVIVTFFVVFNPYVENKELLEKETGLPVLASLEKVKGDK